LAKVESCRAFQVNDKGKKGSEEMKMEVRLSGKQKKTYEEKQQK